MATLGRTRQRRTNSVARPFIGLFVASLLILVFVFDPFRDLILKWASRATASKTSFALFLGCIFVVPAILLFV